MNSLSLLNDLSFWDKIGSFFDIIPKVIYLLYACIASAVDAMQLLVRRLCGLDTYYVNGQTTVKQDPVTEFITGILGVGDSAGTMQVLNTTFVSLAIFALILLALSSIIALIKSHYNEDTGKTSPIKILYNAFKSVVTFAIVPIVVILGLQLSGLLLRTLDNITAASATEESLAGVYGSSSLSIFKPSGEIDNVKYYSSYELFGQGETATGMTMSGQLFKAAAYECNRVRKGDYNVDTIKGDGVLNFGIFGQGSSYDSASSKTEYMAYQIDYAFMNNLQLQSSVSYQSLKTSANNADVIVGSMDLCSTQQISYFSKYNTSLIWIYYNLWNFNFIVGFAGAITCFGIMISIIIGLMMRLIKSAAMFLIYPPLLGLSPIDDFKAFKSWSNEFIKQILSAFGAIIGINLLFLILPFVQTITFFKFDLLNSIVNLVFLVTGLIMAKDFISMVSGFVGGGDVFATGESNKGQVAGTIKKGTIATVAAGAAGAGATLAPVAMGTVLITKPMVSAWNKKRVQNLEEQEFDINTSKRKLGVEEEIYNKEVQNAENDWTKKSENRSEMDDKKNKDAGLNKIFKSAYDSARLKALSSGKSATEADDIGKDAGYTALDKELEKSDSKWANAKKKDIFGKDSVQKAKKSYEDTQEEIKDKEDNYKKLSNKLKNSTQRNYLNEDGSISKKGMGQSLWNISTMATGPLKVFATQMTASLNVDKLAKSFKELTNASFGKDAEGNDAVKSTGYSSVGSFKDRVTKRKELEKEAVAKGYTIDSPQFKQYIKEGMKDAFRETSLAKDIASAIGRVFEQFLPGYNRSSAAVKPTGDKLGQKQLEQQETTNTKLQSLINTMDSFIKKVDKN